MQDQDEKDPILPKVSIDLLVELYMFNKEYWEERRTKHNKHLLGNFLRMFTAILLAFLSFALIATLFILFMKPPYIGLTILGIITIFVLLINQWVSTFKSLRIKEALYLNAKEYRKHYVQAVLNEYYSEFHFCDEENKQPSDYFYFDTLGARPNEYFQPLDIHFSVKGRFPLGEVELAMLTLQSKETKVMMFNGLRYYVRLSENYSAQNIIDQNSEYEKFFREFAKKLHAKFSIDQPEDKIVVYSIALDDEKVPFLRVPLQEIKILDQVDSYRSELGWLLKPFFILNNKLSNINNSI